MNLNDLSFEEVKTLANNVEGFKFHHMTGEVKLKEALVDYLEANPDKIPGDDKDDDNGGETPPVEPPVDRTPPDNGEVQEDLVKIKSDYRGKIASSFGMLDFGTDGIGFIIFIIFIIGIVVGGVVVVAVVVAKIFIIFSSIKITTPSSNH